MAKCVNRSVTRAHVPRRASALPKRLSALMRLPAPLIEFQDLVTKLPPLAAVGRPALAFCDNPYRLC